MNQFIGLPSSPYSDRAQWALEYCNIPFRYRLYVPVFGVPALRLWTRKLSGTLQAPILKTAVGKSVHDSYEIAQYAQKHGTPPTPLFPNELEAQIRAWNQRTSNMLDAGRAISLRNMAMDKAAMRDQLSLFPKGSRGPLLPVASFGVKQIIKKYNSDAISDSAALEIIAQGLDTLRDALNGALYLFDEFTYADIAASGTLTFVKPHETFPLPPATRRCYTNDTLVSEYSDLLAWRDKLYETHRTFETRLPV